MSYRLEMDIWATSDSLLIHRELRDPKAAWSNSVFDSGIAGEGLTIARLVEHHLLL